MNDGERPLLLRPGGALEFPDPERFGTEGLVAIGGDLSTQRLVFAYQNGIFPWYNEGYPILWWSPDPRAVMSLDRLHVSRSMRRELHRSEFQVTWDRDFNQVIRACGSGRKGGTWILPEVRVAYERLHAMGLAHSVEVWRAGKLVGGLYGVHVGGLFAAESMFHRATNASKIALIHAVRTAFASGIELFDVQFATDHLRSMGSYEIPRREYLRRVGSLAHKAGVLVPPANARPTDGF